MMKWPEKYLTTGDDAIPSRPPVPKDGQPGFIGINFVDPDLVYQGRTHLE
jgi:hypothetical protein